MIWNVFDGGRSAVAGPQLRNATRGFAALDIRIDTGLSWNCPAETRFAEENKTVSLKSFWRLSG
jgi:hypothetical protein